VKITFLKLDINKNCVTSFKKPSENLNFPRLPQKAFSIDEKWFIFKYEGFINGLSYVNAFYSVGVLTRQVFIFGV
jgi:hypothetical protein